MGVLGWGGGVMRTAPNPADGILTEPAP
jgi:hypothetical protein